ncbi:hypothetical protein SAMN05444401_2219 [Clostridium amylolyticum]|uniref:DUF5305 domain-containing protein n=1 Tax=Clostridium amylolyticum TaxID=1121298 RepID=A0A1M6GRS4_9CLOT|nr:DUF5305 family protein [Clostridium amylolyticum]SHJ12675.1 hypothetical protein SAMN05444401_2219 [Clostridium amylolyticum]
MKSIGVNRNLRKAALLLCSLIIMACCALLINTLLKNKLVEKKEVVFKYNHKASVNYGVSLVPNNIFDKKVLEEGNIYLTDYVDGINTSFKYNFVSDKPAEIKGQYEVIALVEGFLSNDKNSKSVWSKQFVVKPKTEFSVEDPKGEMKSDITLDLRTYNSLVQQANKTFGMNFIGKLTVVWRINMQGSSSYGDFSETFSPKMEMALNEKYFQITGNLNENKEGNKESVIKITNPKLKTYILMSLSGIAFSIILGICVLIFTVPKRREKNTAGKAAKILKTYEDKLVALRDDSVDGSEVIIRVVSMEDLRKIAEDLDKPIFYKYTSNLEEITYFYVVDSRKIYAYYII